MKFTRILIVLFVSFFLSASLRAQEVPGIVYFDADWKEATAENHEFYRIQTMNKDGLLEFKDYWKTGELQNIGQYSSLDPKIKEGEWIYYYRNGKIKSTGKYNQNNLIGTYKYYDEQGKFEKEFVNSVDSLDNAKEYIEFGNVLLNYLTYKTKYPKYSRRNNEEGKLLISLEISPKGEIVNHFIYQSVSPKIDEAALNALKKYGKYPIAFYNKRPVSFYLNIPINFKLID